MNKIANIFFLFVMLLSTIACTSSFARKPTSMQSTTPTLVFTRSPIITPISTPKPISTPMTILPVISLDKISYIAAILETLFVSVTVFLILKQLRLQSASHIITSLSTIYERWDSEISLRARHSICERWLSGERSFDPIAEYIAEFFEELGIYCKQKAINDKTMWDAYSWYIEHYGFGA